MSIKHSDDVIWSWYQTLQMFWKSDLSPTKFCRKYNLDITKFTQFRYRIEFFSRSDPEYIKKLLSIRHEAISNKVDYTAIALNYNIKAHRICDASTHIGYAEKIKLMLDKKGMILEPHLLASLDTYKSISESIIPKTIAEPEPEYNADKIPDEVPSPPIQEEPAMKFIQVGPTVSKTVEPEPPEIIEKQNDLEIIIAKGVKVSISPNIDSLKIIKIIELLKDL